MSQCVCLTEAGAGHTLQSRGICQRLNDMNESPDETAFRMW
jgi:hypothetical protein